MRRRVEEEIRARVDALARPVAEEEDEAATYETGREEEVEEERKKKQYEKGDQDDEEALRRMEERVERRVKELMKSLPSTASVSTDAATMPARAGAACSARSQVPTRAGAACSARSSFAQGFAQYCQGVPQSEPVDTNGKAKPASRSAGPSQRKIG